MASHAYLRLQSCCGCLMLLVLILTQTGCGTMKGGRRWGEDAFHPVRGERIAHAAKKALLDPVTWVPAVGAAVFTVGDLDRRTSDWAADHTPVFGSIHNAQDTSDVLVRGLRLEMLVTGLLTPGGKDPAGWGSAKAKGLLLECGSLEAVSLLTGLGKDFTDRLRPDGSDHNSFPSGHTSSAFGGARLANRNLDAMHLSPWVRTPLKAGNLIAASLTGWARVEGRRHHPSDVLVGACLGNFVTSFIHDAFLNLPEDSGFSFYAEPSPQGIFASTSWSF